MSPWVGKTQNLILSSKDHGTLTSQVSMPTSPMNNIYSSQTFLCSKNPSNAESCSLLSFGIFKLPGSLFLTSSAVNIKQGYMNGMRWYPNRGPDNQDSYRWTQVRSTPTSPSHTIYNRGYAPRPPRRLQTAACLLLEYSNCWHHS